MEIEFDPDKDALNIVKHGVSLRFGEQVFHDDAHAIVSSLRPIDGEHRYKALGMIDGRLWTTVFVQRERIKRVISVRRSNDGEQKLYDRA